MNMRARYLSVIVPSLLCLLFGTPLSAVVQGEAEQEKKEQHLTQEAAERYVEEIAPVVEELRGLKFKRPVPVELIDAADARKYMIRRIESFQTREQLRDEERAYQLLGLLPAGTEIMELYLKIMSQEVGGFYDPPSGRYYIMEDVPAGMGRMVAAHELTHALEDQYFGLDDKLLAVVDDDDQLFARSAIHEGSATLLMYAYLARAALGAEMDAGEIEAYADAEALETSALNELPQVLQRQLIAPYLLGASFLARGNILTVFAGGYPINDIDRAYADEPLSSEQIIHPAKYWEAGRRDDPQRLKFDEAGRALGPRWSKRADGVLGEMTIGVMVGAPTPDMLDGLTVHIGTQWTNDAATGWDGDRWELWVRGESALVLLGTIWDSEADAEEFAEALDKNAGLSWKLDGNRVAIVAGDAGEKNAQLLELILAAR